MSICLNICWAKNDQSVWQSLNIYIYIYIANKSWRTSPKEKIASSPFHFCCLLKKNNLHGKNIYITLLGNKCWASSGLGSHWPGGLKGFGLRHEFFAGHFERRCDAWKKTNTAMEHTKKASHATCCRRSFDFCFLSSHLPRSNLHDFRVESIRTRT